MRQQKGIASKRLQFCQETATSTPTATIEEIHSGSESDSEQQTPSARVQSRGEIKARKALSKLGLQKVKGVNRVTIRRSGQPILAIAQPDVYKSLISDTYIVFGEGQVEDLNALQSQLSAAQDVLNEGGESSEAGATAAAAEDDEEEVDAEGVSEGDIDLVIAQANCSRAKAVKALKANNNDIVNAIMNHETLKNPTRQERTEEQTGKKQQTNTPDMPRETHLETTIGKSLVSTIAEARVLMVGAGGIGCELLKNLVMSGFKNIEIIDLDTIDLSNLNRQFLFQKQHIKKSKAHIAKASALAFNPNVNIVSRHQNIKEHEFSVDWFKGFDLVMNALDNLDARRHVNKMCLAANVPLIESGTAGYLGQVTVIQKDKTECFDCQPKETPKTFPVCTIRSTPSTPIHCIVWAKSYLFGLLFGNAEDDDDEVLSRESDADEETAKELEALAKESQALKAILASADTEGFAQRVFDKVFYTDIQRLRSMEDMWKTRKAPTPLKYDEIVDKAQGLPEAMDATDLGTSTLKDQRAWTLQETVQVFCDSLEKLTARLKMMRKTDPEASVQFDKDDAETLDFVTATANLRARVYGIEEKTRFQVKAMAGNIIPAIATTNAIIAGMMVMLAFKILNKRLADCKTSYVVYGRHRPQLLVSEPLAKPNPRCYICRNSYIGLKIDTERSTVQDLINLLEDHSLIDVEIQENGRVIHDPDFDDNVGKTLVSLQLTDGKFVDIVDEDDRKIIVCLKHEDESGLGEKKYGIEGDIDHALQQQTLMRQQLKEAEAAAAAHEHQEDPDVIMADDNKKRKHDEISNTTEPDVPLKKSTREGVAHPPTESSTSHVDVGDGTSRAQAVDVDEVIVVDGESFDVVILD
ncbi:E1 ubiquitin-activating protein uba2 [Haplosporangium sp. Z 767]|nr:E1 ubiquitin-activating protein uba2 [Haplosporangium sp. Z 767]